MVVVFAYLLHRCKLCLCNGNFGSEASSVQIDDD